MKIVIKVRAGVCCIEVMTCSRAEELLDMESEILKIFPDRDAVLWHISPHFISALSDEMIRTVLSYNFIFTNHSILYIIVWNVLDQCSERQEGKIPIVPWCCVLIDLCLKITLCNLHLWNPNTEFSSHKKNLTHVHNGQHGGAFISAVVSQEEDSELESLGEAGPDAMVPLNWT